MCNFVYKATDAETAGVVTPGYEVEAGRVVNTKKRVQPRWGDANPTRLDLLHNQLTDSALGRRAVFASRTGRAAADRACKAKQIRFSTVIMTYVEEHQVVNSVNARG